MDLSEARKYEADVDSKILALLTSVFPCGLEFMVCNQWTYNPETDDPIAHQFAEQYSTYGNADDSQVFMAFETDPLTTFTSVQSEAVDDPDGIMVEEGISGLDASDDFSTYDIPAPSSRSPRLSSLAKDIGPFIPPQPKNPPPDIIPNVALDPLGRLIINMLGRIQIRRPDFIVTLRKECLVICENKLWSRKDAVNQLHGYICLSLEARMQILLALHVLEGSAGWKSRCSDGTQRTRINLYG